MTKALRYCTITDGKVTSRRTLLSATEDIAHRITDKDTPLNSQFGPWQSPAPTGSAAFHADARGTLHALYYVDAPDDAAMPTGMVIQPIVAAEDTAPIRLPLQTPLSGFFTASERTGNAAADTIDLYGSAPAELAVRYAQIHIR